MTDFLREFLLSRRGPDGFFESRLSDSAVSTAVARVALEIADARRYAREIDAAGQWLATRQNDDGLYGDSPESPANLTATFLAYVALCRDESRRKTLERAESWLLARFGDFSFSSVRRCFLAEYGKDLTFSVPILALATAAGFFEQTEEAWHRMPRFPFEAVLFPEKLFKYLNLPVVSYALPALICVGLAQLAHAPSGLLKNLRLLAKNKALRVLSAKQPESGGFLEAAPLTAFCALCLCAAGLRDHPATVQSLRFLLETQRDNGAWPIDRDLRQWVTSLSLSALAPGLSEEDKLRYREAMKERQTRQIHPFTRSAPGGWGWTTHPGSVPDADDTAAALLTLHRLGEDASESVRRGITWLLDLQNGDGGIPTFCRGWGRLPFDRSCPDISAHAYRAFSCYGNDLPGPLRKRVFRAKNRILRYLQKIQRKDGAFVPLWFGDQDAASKEAPVYGSAVVLEHLHGADVPFLRKTKEFLLARQHPTGGWGGEESDRDCVTVTSRCVAALSPYPETEDALRLAREFLGPFASGSLPFPKEPIGLYFSHLWYDEELYAPIFLLSCR